MSEKPAKVIPLPRTIELGVISVECHLRLEEEHIFANEGAVSCPPESASLYMRAGGSPSPHTSNAIPHDTAHQTIHPVDMLLRLADDDRVSFLQHFMYCDDGFERLDLVGKNGLSVQVMSANQYGRRDKDTYTFMPAQKASEDLWSHV